MKIDTTVTMPVTTIDEPSASISARTSSFGFSPTDDACSVDLRRTTSDVGVLPCDVPLVLLRTGGERGARHVLFVVDAEEGACRTDAVARENGHLDLVAVEVGHGDLPFVHAERRSSA